MTCLSLMNKILLAIWIHLPRMVRGMGRTHPSCHALATPRKTAPPDGYTVTEQTYWRASAEYRRMSQEYHEYHRKAFVHHKLGQDVAPGVSQTFAFIELRLLTGKRKKPAHN